MSVGELPGRRLAKPVLVAAGLAGIWSSLVRAQVPDPYLDEVFHVRQAQVYCTGDFQTWDPKITTPPGLYLVSYVLFLLTGRCDIDFLRLTNAGALCLIVVEAYYLLLRITQASEFQPSRNGERVQRDVKRFQQKTEDERGGEIAHTALNVALFPPVFFFSALYYTDLQSLLVVLFACHLCMIQLQSVHLSWKLVCFQILLGLSALLFRQTNVFWVGLFPIGYTIPHIHRATTSKNLPFLGPEPWLEDFMDEGFSIVVKSLKKFFTIIRYAIPYCVIIGAFVSFVAWNNGVVLGDKSNHVATLHLPQMLYIWPCFLFFSFPIAFFSFISRLSRTRKTRGVLAQLPRIWILVMFSSIALVGVHYNTIIHPFTLADNRHYIFYVFKVLRKHWTLKYLAVPAYIACGWIILQAPVTANETAKKRKLDNIQRRLISIEGRRRIGYLLVWLATTALCLITAPLVEPRYFIVPWVIWRLSIHREQQKRRYLWLETIWYCTINMTTCCMFLFRPFEWMQEPGRKQRFMW